MAFKDVNAAGGNFDSKQKATEMAVGETLTGYLTAINERVSEVDGSIMHSLIFNQNGKNLLFYPAGNIKYMIADKKLSIGANTRVTRTEDKQVGKGKFKKTSSQFKVEQDLTDKLSSGESVAS